MNSEKVKEIKRALEQNNAYIPFINEHYNWDEISYADILTLINELESENKELRVVTDIANERTYRKKFTDEWRKEYQKELDKQGNGYIAGHPDFDLVYKLYFEQKDRIAELEKENTEQLKQFAKRLKDKFYYVFGHEYEQSVSGFDTKVLIEHIDETLKEYEK